MRNLPLRSSTPPLPLSDETPRTANVTPADQRAPDQNAAIRSTRWPPDAPKPLIALCTGV